MMPGCLAGVGFRIRGGEVNSRQTEAENSADPRICHPPAALCVPFANHTPHKQPLLDTSTHLLSTISKLVTRQLLRSIHTLLKRPHQKLTP